MKNTLENLLKQARQDYQVSSTKQDSCIIDVQSELINMLHASEWSRVQLEFFHGWMKKLDVAKKHYQQYKADWKLSVKKTPISSDCYQLSLLLALKYLDEINKKSSNSNQLLKTCNVIYKVIDYLKGSTAPNKTDIESHLSTLLLSNKVKVVSQSDSYKPINNESPILPITVLFWEGPIARAYLATIKEMGYKVRKIIKLVSSVDLITKKPVGRFLPSSMRTSYAANKQFKQIFYWPNQYKTKHPKTINSIQQAIANAFEFKVSTQASATENNDLQQYTEELESLSITNLRDQVLEEKINAEDSDLFLFTGGGIVPDNLLTMDNKRLIHIHPGYLPHIRGADCVLWSQLIAHRLSASAFFLSPGIDVGDIILPVWLPDLDLKLPKELDIQIKYRMLYGFIDPWVRSYVLKQSIYTTNGLKDFNTTKQLESDGMTYHFMHEKMKKFSLNSFN